MNFRKKNEGVVLLSCLVFLLILLMLLRFTLSSARLEELKVGADIDEMMARETAEVAMNDAEDFILNNPTIANRLNQLGALNQLRQSSLSAAVRGFWLANSNWQGQSGIYDGNLDVSDPNGPCANQLCTNRNINWNNPAGCGVNTLCAGAGTNGQYIIEVFQGNSPGGKLQLGKGEEGTILFRVTAAGYSTNAANATQVILQNTYIFGGMRPEPQGAGN